MKKKKRILVFLIVATFLFALSYSYGIFRLSIIRASLEWDLPGWLLPLIWGW